MIKNLLIFYNVVFLFGGNILLTNIHYHHNHSHTYESHVSYECSECVTINNNSDSILDFHDLNFSNNNTTQFKIQYIAYTEFNLIRICNSRAPPIS